MKYRVIKLKLSYDEYDSNNSFIDSVVRPMEYRYNLISAPDIEQAQKISKQFHKVIDTYLGMCYTELDDPKFAERSEEC